MKGFILSAIVIFGSATICAYLDINNIVTSPSLFWIIGGITGVIGLAAMILFDN